MHINAIPSHSYITKFEKIYQGGQKKKNETTRMGIHDSSESFHFFYCRTLIFSIYLAFLSKFTH